MRAPDDHDNLRVRGPDGTRTFFELRRTGVARYNDYPDGWGIVLALVIEVVNAINWRAHHKGWTLYVTRGDQLVRKERFATREQARAAQSEAVKATPGRLTID